jgi:hypothetical protein
MTQKNVFTLLGIVSILFFLFVGYRFYIILQEEDHHEEEIHTFFACENGENISIRTEHHHETETDSFFLILENGEEFVLKENTSIGGALYFNEEEEIIVLQEGERDISVQIKTEKRYEKCREVKEEVFY